MGLSPAYGYGRTRRGCGGARKNGRLFTIRATFKTGATLLQTTGLLGAPTSPSAMRLAPHTSDKRPMRNGLVDGRVTLINNMHGSAQVPVNPLIRKKNVTRNSTYRRCLRSIAINGDDRRLGRGGNPFRAESGGCGWKIIKKIQPQGADCTWAGRIFRNPLRGQEHAGCPVRTPFTRSATYPACLFVLGEEGAGWAIDKRAQRV